MRVSVGEIEANVKCFRGTMEVLEGAIKVQSILTMTDLTILLQALGLSHVVTIFKLT